MGWSTTSLSIMLIGYVIFCFAMMYFCMLADPSESTIAYQFQITLPNKVWNKLSQAFGKEKMNSLQHVMDRALVLVYFIVVGGSWSVVFWYLYPWLYQSTGVSNVHGVIGVLVFLACFVSWGVANSSHPGKITASSFKRYDHYPYDNLLFLPEKRCETTKLIKVPRSKFDRIKYQCIVPRYDHFCGWTYNTYGEENYRWFLLFLAQHVAMCFYGSYVSVLLFRDEIRQKKLFELTFFDRSTGEIVDAGYSILLQYLFARRTLECCVLTIMFVMGIALSCFFGYHIYLTSRGQTTNENSKWSDIKHWHNRQKQRYEQAVKEGKIKKTDNSNSNNVGKPPVDDSGDVTCTPGNDSKRFAREENSTMKLDYFDPGPVPKNIYDRGFVENWREVIFPLSLRTGTLQLGGYSQQSKMPTNQVQESYVSTDKPKAI